MGKYGDVARRAATLIESRPSLTPRDAWNEAAAEVFPESRSARLKACPRDAFLGLCEMGAVGGIPAGSYTRSVKNKAYVSRALETVRRNPGILDDQRRLWITATQGLDKKQNGQLDVLDALWRSGWLT